MAIKSDDPISFTKAVKGIVEPKNYIKAGIFSTNIGIMVLLVIGVVSVFNFFFPKKSVLTQKQTTGVVIQKGAHVEQLLVSSSQEQNIIKKTVGLEMAISSQDMDTTFVKYLNDSLSAGVGIRYRFDKEKDDSSFVPVVKVRWDFM